MKSKLKLDAGTFALFLFIIFAVILIIQLILKLSGHSPTEIQIIYIAIGGIMSYLLIMSYKLGQFVGEVREFMDTTKNSFRKLRADAENRRLS